MLLRMNIYAGCHLVMLASVIMLTSTINIERLIPQQLSPGPKVSKNEGVVP